MEEIYRYSNGRWTKKFVDPEEIKAEDNHWTERFHELINFDGNVVKNETEEDHESIWGSYIYYQSLEKEEDYHSLQFYLDCDELLVRHMSVPTFMEKTEEALLREGSKRNPIETFCIMIKNTTGEYMKQIDTFEDKLHKVLWEVKERNNIHILDQVAAADHQLLICKTQVVTVTEIYMVLEEVFGKEAVDSKYHDQLGARLKRAKFLIDAYEEEIDALLDFENLVSSYRGNEITKTLTVFTALFAPATLLGAIWGMNFKYMPELDLKFGYVYALLSIIVVTTSVYLYLKGKGWMGDLLDTKNKKHFF